MSKPAPGLAISYAMDSASEDEGRNTPTTTGAKSKIDKVASATKARRTRSSMNANTSKSTKKSGARNNPESVLSPKKAGVQKKTAIKRPAKAEPTVAQAAMDAEEADELDTTPERSAQISRQPMAPKAESCRLVGGASKGSRGGKKAGARGGKQSGARGRKAAPNPGLEVPESPEDISASSNLAPKSKPVRPIKREEIPETQPEPDPMDVEVYDIKGANEIRRQAQDNKSTHRGGSCIEAEMNGAEVATRRKLNDMTKKLEALETKYNNLRDIAITESESNFERLKNKVDERSQAANELLASLRTDLEIQRAAALEGDALRKQIDDLVVQNTNLAKEKKTLQESLQESQNEVKGLQAKLAVTRSNSLQNEAVVGKSTAGAAKAARNGTQGNVEASKDLRKQLLKEELYGDLTGLIVRDVKYNEEEGEDIYDCIQTGRNGTLHFHLSIEAANQNASAKGPASNSKVAYEEAEFQYMPLLDEKRDEELLEMLPDYLTEEICFARGQAAKFYSRLVDCLTRRAGNPEE